MPPRAPRGALFDSPVDWGFHIFALGVYLLEQGIADSAEFWDYRPNRGTSYHSSGVLRVWFANEHDVAAYLDHYGYPDLFINHGRDGRPILDLLDQRCFRVHVPLFDPRTSAPATPAPSATWSTPRNTWTTGRCYTSRS